AAVVTVAWGWCSTVTIMKVVVHGNDDENSRGGDGGGCMVAAAVGDESEKGVSWWDGADVMGTVVERE
ncbi:hypothetical protein Tco_1151823, partial [Tanacetum coccineum]